MNPDLNPLDKARLLTVPVLFSEDMFRMSARKSEVVCFGAIAAVVDESPPKSNPPRRSPTVAGTVGAGTELCKTIQDEEHPNILAY